MARTPGRVVLPQGLTVLLPPGPATAGALRVQVPHQAGSAVQRALLAARTRLADESCGRVLSDFESAVERVPLRTVLERRGDTAHGHLDTLVFKDGSGHPRCARPDVLAFTSVGAGTVFVCSRSFARVAARDPVLAEIVLIHEALHTLGLGENPPTSAAITARIEERCSPSRSRPVPRAGGHLSTTSGRKRVSRSASSSRFSAGRTFISSSAPPRMPVKTDQSAAVMPSPSWTGRMGLPM